MFSKRPRTYDQPRSVQINYTGSRTKEQIEEFPSNFIKTSRYTVIDFLPLSLLIQFKRYANIYFLFIAIVQAIPILSPLNPFSAAAPLIFVLGMSMLREGIEDISRHKSDYIVNGTEVTIVRNQLIQKTTWTNLCVGDLVLIKENEAFPADLAVLGSSYSSGVCYIETSSLDGEKNLKPKSAIAETLQFFSDNQNLTSEHVVFECGPPTQALYEFDASIQIQGKKLSLNQKQLLLRGAYLRNTKWVLGAVVYTGEDTKIMRNAEPARSKSSQVEETMNKYILGVLIMQGLFCAMMSILSYIWLTDQGKNHWYLYYQYGYSLTSFLVLFTYFLLYNTMIPISLIVSLEFVKLFQAFFIEKDVQMYTLARDCWPHVSTSSINEELGQVQYVFSDKTGTLTCNQMEFKYCILGDSLYGDLPSEPLKPHSFSKSNKFQHSIFNFYDHRLNSLLSKKTTGKNEFKKISINSKDNKIKLQLQTEYDLAQEYFMLLATAHECLVEKNDDTGELNYQGPSPDEITLVDAASRLGFQFLGASASTMEVMNKNINQQQQVTLLKQFEFDSTRKRMTSIIKHNGIVKVYIKGADNIIKQRLKKDQNSQPYLEYIQDQLSEFSRIGLRTLLMAMKVMSEEEYNQFNDKFNSFSDSLDKERLVSELVDGVERDLTLLGATAVEDKLQDQVPETIADMLRAINKDIKVWMLTGDKLETAENIAKSCRLIQGDMTVLRLSEIDPKQLELKMTDNEDTFDLCVQQGRKKSYLIEGESLALVLEDPEKVRRFVNVSKDCDSVVCCRVTPKQKALVVRMIKNALNKITLAIGDGANDVNMIQEAHIGVGLYGNEGMRAVQASDFAFAEFRCLWRLLFIHGHWSYIRITEMILYFFYKNMIFTIPQLYFSFVNAFSGQTLFDDWYISFYNLIFTALPLIARATLDQDVNYQFNSQNQDKTLPSSQITFFEKKSQYIRSKMPLIYYIGQDNTIFTIYNFIYWIGQGMISALVIFGVTYITMVAGLLSIDGQPNSLWAWSITMFTTIVIVVDIKIVINTRYQTLINFLCVFPFSLILYFFYVVISEYFSGTLAEKTSIHLIQSCLPYLAIILSVGIIQTFDLTILSLVSELYCTVVDALRLFSKYGADQYQVWKGINKDGMVEMIGQDFYKELETIKKKNNQQLYNTKEQENIQQDEQMELIRIE